MVSITDSVINYCNILYRLKHLQGGVTDNFEFQIDDDTEVYRSCSATLHGELFVFGGYSTSNNRKKQVLIPRFAPKTFLGLDFKNNWLWIETNWRS